MELQTDLPDDEVGLLAARGVEELRLQADLPDDGDGLFRDILDARGVEKPGEKTALGGLIDSKRDLEAWGLTINDLDRTPALDGELSNEDEDRIPALAAVLSNIGSFTDYKLRQLVGAIYGFVELEGGLPDLDDAQDTAVLLKLLEPIDNDDGETQGEVSPGSDSDEPNFLGRKDKDDRPFFDSDECRRS